MSQDHPISVAVCTNRRFGSRASCAGNGSLAVLAALGADPRLVATESLCMGFCAFGPNVRVGEGGRARILHVPADVTADEVLAAVDDPEPDGRVRAAVLVQDSMPGG